MIDKIAGIAFTVFAVIVVIAGIGLLILGIMKRVREKTNCTETTFGIVKEILYDYDTINRDDPNSTGPSVLYGLRLLVTLDGTEYEVFNEEYDSNCKYEVGDAVPIKINPDNPNEYYINDGSQSSIFLILLGAGMIIFGVVFGKHFWP